jgi:hypothetical protein
VKERLRPLGGVGSIAVVILVAACGGNSTSGDADDAGGTGGSAQGSGAAPDDGGSNDSGTGGGSGGTPTGGRPSTAGESGAGAPSRGGAGGAPVPPRGGTLGEAGSPDAPMAGENASSAGAGGEDTVSPPEGCTVRTQSSGTNICHLELRCGGDDFLQTYCIDMEIGVWQCECMHGPASLTYNLGRATDLAACGAMAQLCRSDTPPNLVGPVECAPAIEMRSASSCEIRGACTQEIEGFTDATWAVLDETYCGDDGTGRLTCSCSNSGWEYYLDDHDGTTACDAISEFCEDPVEPDFETAEWDCQPQLQSSDSSSCKTQSSCTLTATVAADITVPRRSWIDVACQNSTNGSTCTCIGAPGEFRINRDEPVTGTASCIDMSNFCVGLGDVDFSADPTCSNVSLTTQEESCEAQLQCGASATVSGIEVRTLRPVSVSCIPADGGWSCTCSSDQASTTISVEGSEPWDACTNASEACGEALVSQ